MINPLILNTHKKYVSSQVSYLGYLVLNKINIIN